MAYVILQTGGKGCTSTEALRAPIEPGAKHRTTWCLSKTQGPYTAPSFLTRKWKLGVSFSVGAPTQTTCVVPAPQNILKRGVPEDYEDQNNGELLGADDAGQGVTGEARRARRSGGTGICQKQRQAHAEPLHPSELRQGPKWERHCRREEDREPREPRPPLPRSSRARTAHREPRPSAPVQPLPPKSAARAAAAAAGPVRTCHQPATPARRSRPALRQPRAPAGPTTPFPTRCPLFGARF
ncbi:uncharacterized protein LOC127671119 [Apodemus sylvaticus]|uniref:uncharacterized protein LOC127671119 n=1 Tax=Apodemus sylvaticus TaxID=10129 RepID=UPI002243F710|nr:uncharacterized protein LOC127671119 [Apodemus sylvaticus]